MNLLKRIAITSMVLCVSVVLTAQLWYDQALKQPLSIPTEGVRVEVSKGQSLASVLNRLLEQNLLDNTLAARVYAFQNDLAGEIKVGEFLLPSGTDLVGLFAILTSNDQVQYKITFVEGQTLKETLLRLKQETRLDQVLDYDAIIADSSQLENVLDAGGERSLASILGAQPDHFEGLIYPDTYFFQKGDTDLSLLKRSHRRLLEVLEDSWSAKEEGLPLTSPYEALVLASIIEKETGKPSERAEISGVFVRRLQRGMRLQTDPTVIYGLGDRYQGNITRQHLKEKTAYNTYRIKGLPPTPIALAGKKAIDAALNPLEGETLFFVAKGDGSHHFSKTIDEHNRAVRKYQLNRREDYRSTHQNVN